MFESYKERQEENKKEQREKRQARVRRIIKKKAKVEPLDIEYIKAQPDLLELFEETVMKRAACLERKKGNYDGRIYSQDLNNISQEIVNNFDDYKDRLEKLIDDGEYEVRYYVSVICLRCGFATMKALDRIIDCAWNKKINGVVAYEAREIRKRYNQKQLPAYPGFQVNYKYIGRNRRKETS